MDSTNNKKKKEDSSSSSKSTEAEGEMSVANESERWVFQYGVRLLAFGLCLAALLVMLTSSQTIFLGGETASMVQVPVPAPPTQPPIQTPPTESPTTESPPTESPTESDMPPSLGSQEFHARYSYSTAFKFLAGVNGVVCGCSLLSLLYVIFLGCSKPHQNSYFNLFVHDLAMTLLMVAGCAAGTSIGYVAKYGQNIIGWMAICDEFGKFCKKITVSVGLSYVALICYLLLTVVAILKIKSSKSKSR